MCVSGSADGTAKVWNLKSMECMSTFRVAGDVPINGIFLIPKSADQFLICNRTNTVAICNLQGQVKTIQIFIPFYIKNILFING